MIAREPDQFSIEQFDLIVVGGGIQGACVTLEAARRGLRPLLIEREDFGGATSWNSLRIIHGGLRYLQYLDLARFRRSVAEQAWWLRNFPEEVHPLSCLMPLYNRGVKRMDVMRLALWFNRQMARAVRSRACPDGEFARAFTSHVISRDQVKGLFPNVDGRGLRGAAHWQDAFMPRPQRLLMEVLRWAVVCGASALNYMTCTGLKTSSHAVAGVTARCGTTGRDYEFRSQTVVNCCGPWLAELTAGHAKSPLREGLALAFNITLDRTPPSSSAVAVSPRGKRAPTYFVVPHGARTMVGTVHLPMESSRDSKPTEGQIAHFLADLNDALPGSDFTMRDVVEVLPGRLPARKVGSPTPARSPRIVHHQDLQEPAGLVSVVGVKYTTARAIAEKTLREIFQRRGDKLGPYRDVPRPASVTLPNLDDLQPIPPGTKVARCLRDWAASESVVHIDDLLLRRCDTRRNSELSRERAIAIMDGLGWDNNKQKLELARLRDCSSSVAMEQLCSV